MYSDIGRCQHAAIAINKTVRMSPEHAASTSISTCSPPKQVLQPDKQRTLQTSVEQISEVIGLRHTVSQRGVKNAKKGRSEYVYAHPLPKRAPFKKHTFVVFAGSSELRLCRQLSALAACTVYLDLGNG